MFRGFTLSVLVHSVVVAAAVVSWPSERNECERLIDKLRDEQPGISPIDIAMRYPQCASALSVPIDIIDIGDVTNVAAVVKPREQAEADEQILEQQDEELDADPDLEEDIPEDEPDTNSERAEDVDPDEIVIEDDEAEPEEDEADDAKEAPKEEKLIKKKREATDSLDFLDEFEDTLKTKAKDRPKAPPKADDPLITPELKDVNEARRGVGEKTGNTASLQSSMKRQVNYCWRGVDDQPDPGRLVVVVSVKLDIDGNVMGSAKTTQPARRPVGDRPMQTAVERALLAVRKCAPYKLPKDDYDLWKEIEVTIKK
jgi:hypothetical protein